MATPFFIFVQVWSRGHPDSLPGFLAPGTFLFQTRIFTDFRSLRTSCAIKTTKVRPLAWTPVWIQVRMTPHDIPEMCKQQHCTQTRTYAFPLKVPLIRGT